MKKTLALILSALLALTLVACQNAPAETTPATETAATSAAPAETEATAFTPIAMSVAALKGPTGMGLVHLMDAAANNTAAGSYTFTLESDPTAVSASVIQGAVDIACVPVNLASVLYNKTEGAYVCLAINTLGVLHILENGESVQSVADLAGKTLWATGQGSTPEYILNYILEANGIADKVTVEYETEHAALASRLASGDVTLGMLPEPNVSSAKMQNGDLRQALDLTAEWNKVCDTKAVQGCVLVKAAFADEHPEAVAKFAEEYAESVSFVNANTEEAAALCETYGVIPKAPVAKMALPNCNIVYIDGAEMKADLSAFLSVLFASNPASVGGKLPDDAFYYGAN